MHKMLFLVDENLDEFSWIRVVRVTPCSFYEAETINESHDFKASHSLRLEVSIPLGIQSVHKLLRSFVVASGN